MVNAPDNLKFGIMKRILRIGMPIIVIFMTLLLTSAFTEQNEFYKHDLENPHRYYKSDPDTGGWYVMECPKPLVFSCFINACVVRGSNVDCRHITVENE